MLCLSRWLDIKPYVPDFDIRSDTRSGWYETRSMKGRPRNISDETLRALLIRPMRPEDWLAVRAIYLEGIATGDATFQTEAPEWEAWDAAHFAACRLIALREDRTVGWAALSPVTSRPVYAGVAEVSIYVASDERGQGIGSRLMEALISSSERAGIWTLQAGIFPENSASLALHQRCGFRAVGLRERLGQMDGRWRDVLLLERRSSVVGVSHDAGCPPGEHGSEQQTGADAQA